MGLFGLFKKKKGNSDAKVENAKVNAAEKEEPRKAENVSKAPEVETAKKAIEKPKSTNKASGSENAKKAEKPKTESVALSADGAKKAEKLKTESAASGTDGAKKAKNPKTESAASGASSAKPKSETEGAYEKESSKREGETPVKRSATEKKEAEAETNEKKGSGFSGKFEIKKSRDERYVFNLYAANSVIVATSQTYSSAASALNGIKSVIENAEKAPIEDQTLKSYEALPYPKWEIYLDKGNQYRFRLNAPNGSCICHSQGYTGKAACKNGIESIIRTAKNAKIDKSYLKKNQE